MAKNSAAPKWIPALLLLLALLASCQQSPIRILLVGNSLTFYNNLNKTLEEEGRRSNRRHRLVVDEFAVRSSTLKSNWDKGLVQKQMREGRYDVVVLQDFPQYSSRSELFDYATRYKALAEELGAKVVLYMTWQLPSYPGLTIQEIAQNQYDLADSLKIPVAPVGLLERSLAGSHPGLALIREDGVHPTPTLSYAAALSIYTAIFDDDPLASTLRADLPAETRKAAREALHDLLAKRGNPYSPILP